MTLATLPPFTHSNQLTHSHIFTAAVRDSSDFQNLTYRYGVMTSYNRVPVRSAFCLLLVILALTRCPQSLLLLSVFCEFNCFQFLDCLISVWQRFVCSPRRLVVIILARCSSVVKTKRYIGSNRVKVPTTNTTVRNWIVRIIIDQQFDLKKY